MMQFHEKLFGLRKQAGMTQAELAEKLNVSRQAISRWEQGTAMPEIENLIAMSDLFDVTLDYMLKDAQPQKKSVKWADIPKQWRLLVTAATAVLSLLAVWLLMVLLEKSRFGLILGPLIVIGALYLAVKMTKYL